MKLTIGRRSVLTGLAATALPLRGHATEGRFRFADLVEEARRAAGRDYRPPAVPSPDVLDRIDYDAHWRIQYRDGRSVRLGEDVSAQFFHLGRYAREPVAIHLLRDGAAQPFDYDPALFSMPEDSPARALGEGAGFAGLRLMRPDLGPDWLSFLGASYFRSDGPQRQYGLSARGLAIDTGLNRPEEFPRFSAFWLGPGERDGEDAVIYARLESPSVEGAYRFGARREAGDGQRCDVSCRLFFREGVERLGVAPLTSMYWYSETNRWSSPDWRPEVHDSDGLALETGAGERLWRPLRNPDAVTTTSFVDRNPRGFGLIQRDRDFDNYLDDGVFYDRRPSAWIAPRGDWGAGAVQLVEIPTGDEVFDNVVAYWTPERQPAAGDARAFDYALHWRARDPAPTSLARVTATHVGWGGVPGNERPVGVYKYVVSFEGPALEAAGERVDFDLQAHGGGVTAAYVHRVVDGSGWRLVFDLTGADRTPVELRAYLKQGDSALSETWTMLADHRTAAPW
jgi:glucans biosynthesis protein